MLRCMAEPKDPRARAYWLHGRAANTHAMARYHLARAPHCINALTALHLAAVNLGQAEEDLADWQDEPTEWLRERRRSL